jgi:hypothetical protein
MKKLIWLVLVSLFVVSCGSDDSESNPPCDLPIVDIQSVDRESAIINWLQENGSTATLEYGVSGFSLGSGTQISSTQSFEVNGLDAGTAYDVYLNAICDNGETSDFAGPFSFTTEACFIPSLTIFEIQATSIEIGFNLVGDGYNVEFEYGISGFTLGDGISFQTDNANGGFVMFTLPDLIPETIYDIYAKSICGNVIGEYRLVRITTLRLCERPEEFTGVVVNSSRVNLEWSDFSKSASRVEYGISGFSLGTGETIDTASTSVSINNLTPGVTYDFYVQNNCSDGFSDFAGPVVLTPN